MKKKYDLTFAEAQDLEAKTNIDTYWNDGDIVIEESYITQTIGNVLQFGMDYQKAIDDAELHERFEKVLKGQKWDLIDKACEWLARNAFAWIEDDKISEGTRKLKTQKTEELVGEFRKAMEE